MLTLDYPPKVAPTSGLGEFWTICKLSTEYFLHHVVQILGVLMKNECLNSSVLADFDT